MLLLLLACALEVQCKSFTRLDDPDINSFRRQPTSWAEIFNEQILLFAEDLDAVDFHMIPGNVEGMASSVVFDVDNDGDIDIFVPTGHGQENALFLNQLSETGEMRFKLNCGEVSCASKYQLAFTHLDSNAACIGDIDNDGDQDLVVLNMGAPWQLLRNDGGNFTDISIRQQEEIGPGYAPTTCIFGDVNNDGYVDLFITYAADFPLNAAMFQFTYDLNKPNRLYINQGTRAAEAFRDETVRRGIQTRHQNLTWSAAFVDYDLDGDVDLFLFDDSGPFIPENVPRGNIKLWQNDGFGMFKYIDVNETGLNSGSNMGYGYGDVNCDGFLDFFVTRFGAFESTWLTTKSVPGVSKEILANVANHQSSQFAMGAENGTFVINGPQEGPNGPNWLPFGWGTALEDVDNDGDQDLIYVGGIILSAALLGSPAMVLENEGQCSGNFRRSTAFKGLEYRRYAASGLSTGDFNNDGYVDFVSVSGPVAPNNADGSSALVPYKSFLRPELAEMLSTSEVFEDMAAYPMFFPPANTTMSWSGARDENGHPKPLEDGVVVVELNDASDENNWVKIKLRGSFGDIPDAKANRDGTGAVIRFTPLGGKTIMVPHTSGVHRGAHDATHIFGMGTATQGEVQVMWPGGNVNTVQVFAGDTVVVPEIPCNVNDEESVEEFRSCLGKGLNTLVDGGVLEDQLRDKLFSSLFQN